MEGFSLQRLLYVVGYQKHTSHRPITQLIFWAVYGMVSISVITGLVWYGRYLAVYGIGHYNPQQAVGLLIDVAIVVGLFLVFGGALLRAYRFFLLEKHTVHTLHTPADQGQRRMVYLFLIIAPMVPFLILSVPALSGIWSVGWELTTVLTYTLLILAAGAFASLIGLLWFLLSVYGVYHLGLHAAFWGRAVRGILFVSLALVIVTALWSILYGFFANPPFGPVGEASSFGGGVVATFLAWLSATPYYWYVAGVFILNLAVVGYVSHQLFSFLFLRRYELLVSFKEAATRASRRLATYVWFPVESGPFTTLLQIEILQWSRNGPRLFGLFALAVAWLVLLGIVMVVFRGATEVSPVLMDLLAVSIPIVLGVAFLILMMLRSVLPYLLSGTAGAKFLHSVPVARTWLLRAQLVVTLFLLLVIVGVVGLFAVAGGLISAQWSGIIGMLLLLLVVGFVGWAGVLRIYITSPDHGYLDSSRARRYRELYLLVVGSFTLGVLAVALLAVISASWWLLAALGAVLLAVVTYVYYKAERCLIACAYTDGKSEA